MTQIYLVRHGETDENVARLLQGHMPGHLTARGMAQTYALRDLLKKSGFRFDYMLVSDLRRTMLTAEILNSSLHLPLLPCPMLRERDWGSLTGMPIGTFDADHAPSDVESVEQMFHRARRALLYIRYAFPDKQVLCVSHGLFGRCLQAELFGKTIADIPRMNNCEMRRLFLG